MRPLNYEFHMNKPTPNPELAAFRKQIDDIDDQLIRLLLERTKIIGQVGELKRRIAPGICPIRPGREAEMVRRIISAFDGTTNTPKLAPSAAAAMWRTLIGASTSLESNLTISVFTPERESDLFWMAREYFGPSVQITRQPYVKRVIGDVMDGKAAVGIMPVLRSSDTTFWWTNLTQQNNDTPKVFAQIPFVYHGTPARNVQAGLAIAKLTPEDSGDDQTLLVLEVDQNVSQNKLQTSFATAKLEATWINIATLIPNVRHHLIELKGFVTPEHEGIKSLLTTLGPSVYNVAFLGSYAVPVIIETTKISSGANVAV